MRCRATLAYDGTAYHGFQRQANASPTIQGSVEAALAEIAGRPVGVIGAGRTDAGVHATGQVIAFDLDWRHPLSDLRNALNAFLPADIAVRVVDEAAAGFHPRYNALSREYKYAIYVAPVRDPLRRWRAWHLTQSLDDGAIAEAVRLIVGTYDFSAFGKPPQGENAVRTVYEARWKCPLPGEHHFTIRANAFLFRMVRTLVGTLVWVGQQRVTAAQFEGILSDRERGNAGPPAPPYGLVLTGVQYDDRAGDSRSDEEFGR